MIQTKSSLNAFIVIIGCLSLFTISCKKSSTISATLTINNPTAGLLYATISSSERSVLTNLTLTGIIDASDFVTMRDSMPVLSVLSLSGTTIVSYTGNKGTSGSVVTTYPENTIPNNAFNSIISDTGKVTLTSVVVPLSCKSIGSHAFEGCTGLTSVTLNSITTIDEDAFAYCNSMNTMYIPYTVTRIGANSFLGSKPLLTVDANDTIYSSISGVLFNKAQDTLIHCSLYIYGGYIVPSTVRSISENAFNGSHLTSVTLLSSVLFIGNGSFANSANLTSITIPPSLQTIGNNAFINCQRMVKINLPQSLTSIGISAFNGCGASIVVDVNNPNYSSQNGVLYNKSGTSILSCPSSFNGSYLIPSTVTKIESMAFANCSFLSSITIPSSVNSIGSYAFLNCGLLHSIILNTSIPINLTTSSSVFSGVNVASCVLQVPIGSKSAYQSVNQWNVFGTIVEQ